MIKKQKQKGVITQKLMTFRIDLDNWEYLKSVKNKGRLINELIEGRIRQEEDILIEENRE